MNYPRIVVFLFITSVLTSAAFVSFTGCSKNATSPPTDTTKKTDTTKTTDTIPTIGSSFVTIDNNSDTTFDTIVATSVVDTAHHGSTVRQINETSIGPPTGVYESFLANGDLALEGSTAGWGNSGVFYVLPFVSHTTVIDTFQYSAGGGIHDSLVAVYHPNSSQYSLNGHKYPTDSVTVTTFLQGANSIQYYYTFVPSLGLIAFDSTQGSTSEWLISYSPK